MSPSPRRHSRLIAANCVALAALALVTLAFSGQSNAQQGGGRPRGIYTVLSGRANGMTEHVVWVVDAANHEVVALDWDHSTSRFTPIGYRNLVDDAAFQRRAR